MFSKTDIKYTCW